MYDHYVHAPEYPKDVIESARQMALKLPREYQNWFIERFSMACYRAFKKWGTWPGWALKGKIFAPFVGAIRHGRVGNREFMFSLRAKKLNKKRFAKAAMEGKTRSQVGIELNEAKKRKKYQRLVEEAEARRRARDVKVEY